MSIEPIHDDANDGMVFWFVVMPLSILLLPWGIRVLAYLGHLYKLYAAWVLR